MTKFLFVCVSVIAYFTLTSIKRVPQGQNAIVQRFGRYLKTLPPGIHFIAPLIDQTACKIAMTETALPVDFPDQQMTGTIYFQVIDAGELFNEKVVKAVEERRTIQSDILNLAKDSLRTLPVSKSPDEVNNSLFELLNEAVSLWGLKITRVEISSN